MKKIILIVSSIFFLLCSTSIALAQDKKPIDMDSTLKESIYHKYKKEVLAFNKKDFDTLFFEFFQKQNDANIKLSKEEYYTYTIKIAIYSEKHGMLYKNKKAEAQQTKKEWFDKKYSDYLEPKK